MRETYSPQEVESEVQAMWKAGDVYRAHEEALDAEGHPKPKFYVCSMLPYPSGKLHMGHVRNYTLNDVMYRFHRMKGYNVMTPMGWDAFGLPAENAALSKKVAPAKWTYSNIADMKAQMEPLGLAFDWSREVATCKPDYYRWNQWMFLKMLEKGIAYRKTQIVNWDPVDKTVLANEQVIEGRGWRSGAIVEKREIPGYYLGITQYAQELLDDLKQLDGWPEQVRRMQEHWIGRSEGVTLSFPYELRGEAKLLNVYTTRADTLMGVTFVAIAAEHPLATYLAKDRPDLKAFIAECAKGSVSEADMATMEKKGVPTGFHVKHPLTGEPVEVWIANYVLMGYGEGAVMAVPAHDERDFAFAKKFGLPIKQVVAVEGETFSTDAWQEWYGDKTLNTHLVNSGEFNGLGLHEAIDAIAAALEKRGLGHKEVKFRLRDWGISRQRYWGEPIPLVNCEKCGWVALPEEQLPLVLPQVESYEPTDDGESPLSKMTDWVNTTCPCCGGPAKRETDTMPQWAGSSWYFLRYMDPHNDKALASKEALDYWSPVDWYNGGMEHTTLHLLYSRFWHKFLYDIGVVPTKEPYAKRTSHGMILGEGGEKMSKSRGNVVNPNDIVAQYGADTMRLHIMFIGDFEKAVSWSNEAVKGSKRFLDRCFNLQDIATAEESISAKNESIVHKTIKKVSQDIDELKMNTAIAAMMTMVNEFYANGCSKGDVEMLCLLLSPFAPHMVEEMWENMGFAAKYGKMAMQMDWPEHDEAKTVDSHVEMAVQVNGKLKGTVTVPVDSDEAAVVAAAMESDKVKKATEGMSVVKTILVRNKLVNLIVKPAK